MAVPRSRRLFLTSAATGLGGLGAGAVVGRQGPAPADPQRSGIPNLEGRSVLLRGGCVLSMDPAVGDFEAADVLIEGQKIAAVRPRIEAGGNAAILDAAGMIVMPGFVDTHRHMWQGPLRNILPNGLLSDYGRDITGAARSVYRPEDAYIGDLVTALGAINAGVTTVLDWSHIGTSPEHTDAAIQGLREAGIRSVYGYGPGAGGPQNRFPQDIRRLRSRHFNSDDQLLTLALATGLGRSDWALARDVGASISVHVNGANQLVPMRDVMGPDVTCIHCPHLTEAEWQTIVDTGAHVSIACPIEMEMGHGVPPIQQALDHGVRPSLSTDVETQMPGDFFTQMRAVFTLQRMLLLARQRAGETKLPPLLSVRQVLEFATIQGAIDNRLERKCGTLTPGKEADILLLRTNDINVLPVNNAYGAVVLGMDTSNVDAVFIGGRLRKWQGRLLGVDLDRVGRQARESRDYVVAKAGWKPSILGRDLPGH
jgi:cytosine/adenosine deaminase-related metal-dependent hydrolase